MAPMTSSMPLTNMNRLMGTGKLNAEQAYDPATTNGRQCSLIWASGYRPSRRLSFCRRKQHLRLRRTSPSAKSTDKIAMLSAHSRPFFVSSNVHVCHHGTSCPSWSSPSQILTMSYNPERGLYRCERPAGLLQVYGALSGSMQGPWHPPHPST